MRKKLLTDRVLAQIPHWIRDEGLGPAEIAEKIGCTIGTLRVRCSNYGISLKQRRGCRESSHGEAASEVVLKHLMLRLPDQTRVGLHVRAELLGLSAAELALALIETINRDDLYSAVLDDSRLTQRMVSSPRQRQEN